MGWGQENRTRIEDAVRLQDSFEVTHARGERSPKRPIPQGRLNADEAAYLVQDADAIAYVVFSYATPIAWKLHDGTPYVTRQSFSNTTGTLQQLVCGEWDCERGERSDD